MAKIPQPLKTLWRHLCHRLLAKRSDAALSPSSRRGQHYEQLAARHLKKQGLKLLSQNFRCRGGEIDLIMSDGDYLVFVEVRYRHRSQFGTAAATVGSAKQQRLRLAAAQFLQRQPIQRHRPCRFDIVAINGDGEREHYQWINGAF